MCVLLVPVLRAVKHLTCSHAQLLVLSISEHVGLKQRQTHCWCFLPGHSELLHCFLSLTRMCVCVCVWLKAEEKGYSITHRVLDTTEKTSFYHNELAAPHFTPARVH